MENKLKVIRKILVLSTAGSSLLAYIIYKLGEKSSNLQRDRDKIRKECAYLPSGDN